MSGGAVSDGEYEQFVELLRGMAQARAGCEARYFALLRDATDASLVCLARAIVDDRLSQMDRMLAYINLKNCTKRVPGSEFVPVLAATPGALDAVKAALLRAFEHEPARELRRRLCFALAAFAGLLVPQRKWDALMGALMAYGESAAAAHRALALRVVATLIVDEGLAGLMQENVAAVLHLLRAALAVDEPSVRAASLDLWSSVLTLSANEATFEPMRDMLPLVLRAVLTLLEAGDEDAATLGIDGFVAVAATDPLFLKPLLGELLDAFMQIIESERLSNRTRRLASEFICSLAENRVGLLRRHPAVVQRLVPVLLRWMTQLQDVPADEWETLTDSDEISRHVRLARDAIDRLAIAFSDQPYMQLVYQHIGPMLADSAWQVRFAALTAAKVSAEGLAEILKQHVDEVVAQFEPIFADPHRRVRAEAQSCLGQMCTDLAPDLQDRAHEVAIRCILRGLRDNESQRVRGDAASTLVNFCELASVDVTARYTSDMLDALGPCLESSLVSTQEWALTAMAAVASSSKSLFKQYVDSVMPVCVNIIRGAKSKEHRQLRGRAFEAASFIGLAVGRERFAPYAQEICEQLVATDFSASSDDPQVALLISSAARLAELLVGDFLPYLERLMPTLTARATSDPMIVSLEDNDTEKDDDEEWDVHVIDGHKCAIYLPSLEEKADALEALARFAEYLRGDFAPYVREVGAHVLETAQQAPNERVHETTISIVPFLAASLANAARRSNGDAKLQEATREFAAAAVNLLSVGVVTEELDVEFQHLYIQTLCELLQRLHDEGASNFLSGELMHNCVQMFNELVENAWLRREERSEEREDEDHDDDLEASFQREEEQDSSILVNAIEMLENTFKTHGAAFVPHWQTLLPLAAKWLDDQNPPKYLIPLDRHLAVCMLDDVVEHGQDAGMQFFDECMRQCMRFALVEGDELVGIRQAALYGLGSSAKAAGERFLPMLEPSLNVLWKTIDKPNARVGPMAQVIENALSAVAKIVLALPNSLDAPAMVTRWLAHLPITADEVEAKVIYTQLVRFAELYPSAVFGDAPAFERLPFVLNVIGTALETPCVDDKVTELFIGLMKHLQQAMPAQVLDGALGALDAVPRARIMRALGHEVAAQ